MTKLKRSIKKGLWWNFPLSRILLEQEEEAADDLFGDEGAEEGGEETADIEADADDEAVDDAGETGTEAEAGGEEELAAADEEVEIKPGDEVRLGKQFDVAIDSILADFETEALKSAVIFADAKEEIQEEGWWNKSLSSMLLEQEEDLAAEEEPAEEEAIHESELDIDKFAEDVARLISNYDVLMDIEAIIFNKAISFLTTKYGEDVSAAFEEALRVRHDLDFKGTGQPDAGDEGAPLAVGATAGGAAGAA